MKAQDLIGKTLDQLTDELNKSKRELLNLRFQKAQGELKDTSKFKSIRRFIARIATRITELQAQANATGGK